MIYLFSDILYWKARNSTNFSNRMEKSINQGFFARKCSSSGRLIGCKDHASMVSSQKFHFLNSFFLKFFVQIAAVKSTLPTLTRTVKPSQPLSLMLSAVTSGRWENPMTPSTDFAGTTESFLKTSGHIKSFLIFTVEFFRCWLDNKFSFYTVFFLFRDQGLLGKQFKLLAKLINIILYVYDIEKGHSSE